MKQVRDILNQEGVLYVGDCKRAASTTRAGIKHASDYYLMPLPATIVPPEVLDTYLKFFLLNHRTIRCNFFIFKTAISL